MKRTPELEARAKQLHADGLTYWEIGFELEISEQTARLWCDDEAREKHRLRAAQFRRPVSLDEARDIIKRLSGCCVYMQPLVKCDGTWAGGLLVHTSDGARHIDEINLPRGLQRRRLHSACRKLEASCTTL